MDLEERVKKIENERDQFASSHKTYTELVEKQIDELKEDFKIKRESDREQINANLEAICWIRKLVLKLSKQKVFFWQLKKEIAELKETDKQHAILVSNRIDDLQKQISLCVASESVVNYQSAIKEVSGLKEDLRDLSLRAYNLHQAILTNTPLEKLTIGKSLIKLYDKLEGKDSNLNIIMGTGDPKRDFELLGIKLKDGEKPSEPFRCLRHSWDNNNKCVNCGVMIDGKEPKPSEPCEHEWEFRDPENIGHSMAFCKKCGYLRGSIEKEPTDVPEFDCPICNKGVMIGYYLHKGCWEELRLDLERIKKRIKRVNDGEDDKEYPSLPKTYVINKILEKYLREEK